MSTLADTAGKSAAGAVDSTKKSVAAGIKSGGLVEGTAKLSKGIDQLYQEGIKPLSGGLDQLNQSAPALMSGINQLNSGAGELTGNNRKLNSGADTLAGSAKQLAGGAEKVNTGVITLKNGTGKLDTGALSLFKGASKLNQGTVTLKKGAAALASGSRQVTDGAGKLSKNLTKLDQEGIKKLVDSYNGDVKELVNHMEAVRDAGEAYKTFTRLSNHMDGKVKFIIRTDSVTTDSDNN
jgi:putative membrane protein